MDLIFAFLGFLLLFFLILSFFHSQVEQSIRRFDSQELQANAVFLADSLLKNRDETNPQYGSAVFSASLHRSKTNEIDLELLRQIPAAQESENSPVFFKKIELKNADGSTETIFDNSRGQNCLWIERFVLVNRQKTVLRGLVCHE
ncbi:MAG: hypothetical protein V1777_04790 [Candidatus Micrarchaeota archaeon]